MSVRIPAEAATTRRTPPGKASRIAREVGRAAGRQVDSLRRADRFTRARFAIVGAWALLSILTVWASCGTRGPSNALGAEVEIVRESIMGAQLFVRNDSDRRWENVVLTLDGSYVYVLPTMGANGRVVLPVADFRRGDEPPPREYHPRSLSIVCDRGRHGVELR